MVQSISPCLSSASNAAMLYLVFQAGHTVPVTVDRNHCLFGNSCKILDEREQKWMMTNLTDERL